MKNKKLKILFQCPQYLPSIGGIELTTQALAKELIKLGHEVTVVCQNYSDKGKKFEIIEGVKVYRYPKPNFSKALAPFSHLIQQKHIKKYLANFLKENSFDIIVSRFFLFVKPTKDILPGMKVIYGPPAVLYLAYRRMADNSDNLWQKIVNLTKSSICFRLEREACERADSIIGMSTSMKKIFEESFGIPSKKIAILPQPVDMKKFNPRRRDEGIKKKLGIYGKKIILTISRLTPDKNISGLIDIFSNIKNKEAVLVIIGEGSELLSLKALCKKLNVADRVFFLGEKKNPENYYNLGNIFALASKQEGFGNVFLEAMASGLPIIGFKSNPPEIVTAVKDIIGRKKVGFAVKNEEEMAAKIELLLNDDNLRKNMGLAAVKHAAGYAPEKLAVAFLAQCLKTRVKNS